MDVPVTNNTQMPMTVGGSIIPPGETFILPAHQVPEHLRPAAAAVTEIVEADPLLALLAGAVKDILPHLPALSDIELEQLRVAETSADNRKTLLSAITEDQLRRANLAEIRKQLSTFDDVTLANYFGDLPDGGDDHVVAEALMRERGLGIPGMLARLENLDRAQLEAHRATLEDNPDELAVVDELLAKLDQAPPA